MEEDNKEIKVGDIVKFKEDTYAINDVGRKENLYGALGMVIEMDYSIPGECFYTCILQTTLAKILLRSIETTGMIIKNYMLEMLLLKR